jgi:signal transduction histidine kinase
MQTETEVMLRAKMATKQDYRETLQSTLEEVHRLRALTDRLLALAAQERIELSEISTKALVDRVVERARPLAQETRITLGVSGTDDEFRVFGNTEAIENILGIFVDNALKYSPEHTAVTIRREVSERRTLRFVVLDQGAGISLEQQERVFERFYRADTSRTSQQVAGNGLGLSLAQRLATEMNGTVGVVSEAGSGSEFYLELPLR